VQEQIAGIAATPADIRAIRKDWEQHVNRAYERAGLDARVDHRSHEDRGIAQEPATHLGPAAAAMERREPGSSDRGASNREIEERNASLRERAALEIEAVKAAAELAAAKQLEDMEHRAAQAEQEARAAARGRTDDIRPEGERSRYDDLRATEHKVSRSQSGGGRYDDLRAAEPLPEIERQFTASAARTTEPIAPIFDRDAASRAADERIIDAAIKQATPVPQEARQRFEPEGGKASPLSRGQAHGAAEPAQAAPTAREPDPAHELAATADAAVDRAAHAGEGLLRGLGKLFSGFVNWLADSIAPPPPPTRDQAERMGRAAEEQATDRAWREAAERQQAEHEFLLREIERSRQSADQIQRPTAAELYGTPKPHAQERDNDRDRDRELEL
jgi:hypothetical protein